MIYYCVTFADGFVLPRVSAVSFVLWFVANHGRVIHVHGTRAS